MARLRSAADLKEALNGLAPEEAWGERADVVKLFQAGVMISSDQL